jgi:ABC-2 type transport system ATP-binding protein
MKSVIAPLYKNWEENSYKKYIKEFALPEKKKIKDLSKGMKMKFSLCMALSHGAELLILDEPTSGLDPVVRSELLEILAYIMQDENKGVFFSTHITSDLDKIADYITLINDGDLLFTAAKDDVIENYCIVKGGREMLDKDTKREFVGLKENSFGFEALATNKSKITKLFGTKVIIEKPTLEEVMLFNTKNKIGGASCV